MVVPVFRVAGRRPASVSSWKRGPHRVLCRVGVVGQDVGRQVRGLGRDGLDRVGAVGLAVVDDVPVTVDDPLDEVRLVVDAAVGQRPVGRRQVDHPDPDRAERERGDIRVLGFIPLQPQPLGLLDDRLGPDELLGFRDRDVQRVLQRVAGPHRPALVVVRIVDLVAGHSVSMSMNIVAGVIVPSRSRSRR